ncbi:MAG: MBOAT family protein, partial [Prevotella salivae]|nr:MBOAT family protein [Segatella salivae]
MIERLISLLSYNPKEPLIFSSGLFLILFLGFSFIYMLLRHRLQPRLVFVTLFSYYFYYKSSGLFFFLLAVVTVSDFFIAKRIQQLDDSCQSDGARKTIDRKRKALVVLSLIIDLGLLGYFKYTNFFAGMICQMIGHNFQPWDIFLPVGISFFTF